MYVLDHDRQISLIRDMVQLRKDSDSWEVYYHQPSTNAMWKTYFPRANEESRGPKIMRTEPVPDHLEDRLEECLVELVPENAIGLGIELSADPSKWEPVMEKIEAHYRHYHRKQLPLFLKNIGIEHYKSLLKEIKCDLKDIDISRRKLNKLARRSKIIRFKRFCFF